MKVTYKLQARKTKDQEWQSERAIDCLENPSDEFRELIKSLNEHVGWQKYRILQIQESEEHGT